MDIVSDKVSVVAQRIGEDLDRCEENTATVITGADDLWDVSIMKFIYEKIV